MRTRNPGPQSSRTHNQGDAPANGGAAPGAPSASKEEYPYLHPLVRRAIEIFDRDRDKHLAEGHSEQEWVAYHGERLIGIAANDLELHQQCVREEISPNEVFFHTLHAIVRRAYVRG